MAKSLVSRFYTYKYRYQIGYAAIGVVFVALLFVAGAYVPGGLTGQETAQFVKTASIDLQDTPSLAVPNIPFYALQRFALNTLGTTAFAFKLPALFFAFLSGVGAILLLRLWFRQNIAVLATVIMITTGQFLYIAQSGTAEIMYVFWSIWILLIASMVTHSQKNRSLWKTLLVISAPLSLYTPLSIYLVLAVIVAGLLHPHIRHVVRKTPVAQFIIFAIAGVTLLSPLAFLVASTPSLGLTLLGIPSDWPPDISANISSVLSQYLDFANPMGGITMTPVLDLGSIILVLVGLVRLYTIRYTARSYTLTAWTALLTVIMLFNPTLAIILFVPLLLLLANGINYLLHSWYRLFPFNPYARFAGIIPIGILVLSLVTAGGYRYFDGYSYDPSTVNAFSNDLPLFNKMMPENKLKTLVVSPNEAEFYFAVTHLDGEDITILTSQPTDGSTHFAATRRAHYSVVNKTPTSIVTTNRYAAADRFYIYKN